MFLLYHSERCNICDLVLHECYVNDLYTTTCSGMLGHHIGPQHISFGEDTLWSILLFILKSCFKKVDWCSKRVVSKRLIGFLQALFIFLQTTIFYHTIRLILYLQQTGEIDNLTASWGKVLWLCCVQVPCCCWYRASPR
jgi:hypothetical protein